MGENAVNEPIEAVRAQRDALLEQVDELEESLKDKQVENEKLGSKVTNLELDVQRRDAEITRLKGQVEDGAFVRALKSDLAFAQNEAKRYQADYTAARKEIVALNIQLQQSNALKAGSMNDEALAAIVTLRNEKAEVEAKLQAVSSERDRLQRSLGGAPFPAVPPEDAQGHIEALRQLNEQQRQSIIALAKERDEAKAEVERWKTTCAEAEKTIDVFHERDAKVSAQVPDGGGIVFTCNLPHAERRKMPDDRKSRTVTLRIGDRKLVKMCPYCEQPLPEEPRCTSFTLHVGMRDDGTIGEFFLKPSHDEKTDLVASLADQWAQASSYALQHGAKLYWLTEHARLCADGSAGVPMVWDDTTGKYKPHPVYRRVKSIIDLAARTLERIASGKPVDVMTPAEENARQKAMEAETAAREAESEAGQ